MFAFIFCFCFLHRNPAAAKYIAKQNLQDQRLTHRIIDTALSISLDEILKFFAMLSKKIQRVNANSVTKMKWNNFDDEDGATHARFVNGRVTIKINRFQNDSILPVIALKRLFRELWPADWHMWNTTLGKKTLESMKTSLPRQWMAAFDQNCIHDLLPELFEINGSEDSSGNNKYTLKIILVQILCKSVLLLHAIKMNFAVSDNDISQSLSQNES